MGLYERLMNLEAPRLRVHQFSAALGEYERGQMTQAQIVAAFGLSAAEETELATLLGKIRALPESYPLGTFLALPSVGTAYDAIAAAKGLGFVAVDVSGITRAELRVRYQKVGVGTLSWQLWNDTDASEVGVGEDTGAAGDDKVIAIVVTPPSPLAGGVKVLRPRVKSTVGTDSPVYYGACLVFRRVARLTADDLHQVLLTAETGLLYGTVVALKTRLGV